jgi:RNA polymerase sigma-70 factor (ECF subfamily)
MSVQIATLDAAELRYNRAFEECWDDIFRFLLAWTNDWAAAEDLAQEAFLKLWGRRNGLDWDRPVLPWLIVVARRLATDRLRSLRRGILPRQSRQSLDEMGRVRWLDVRAALSRLSALERTALLLTAVEGWSYAEVGEALGTTSGALRAAVSRARDKLEDA